MVTVVVLKDFVFKLFFFVRGDEAVLVPETDHEEIVRNAFWSMSCGRHGVSMWEGKKKGIECDSNASSGGGEE